MKAFLIAVLIFLSAQAFAGITDDAQKIAQRGCPACSAQDIRESIYGQIAHSKGDGSALGYACGAMLHVPGPTDKFLRKCFGAHGWKKPE